MRIEAAFLETRHGADIFSPAPIYERSVSLAAIPRNVSGSRFILGFFGVFHGSFKRFKSDALSFAGWASWRPFIAILGSRSRLQKFFYAETILAVSREIWPMLVGRTRKLPPALFRPEFSFAKLFRRKRILFIGAVLAIALRTRFASRVLPRCFAAFAVVREVVRFVYSARYVRDRLI